MSMWYTEAGVEHRFRVIRANGKLETHIVRIPYDEAPSEFTITFLNEGDVVVPEKGGGVP